MMMTTNPALIKKILYHYIDGSSSIEKDAIITTNEPTFLVFFLKSAFFFINFVKGSVKRVVI